LLVGHSDVKVKYNPFLNHLFRIIFWHFFGPARWQKSHANFTGLFAVRGTCCDPSGNLCAHGNCPSHGAINALGKQIRINLEKIDDAYIQIGSE
jgi:hypothetical protein